VQRTMQELSVAQWSQKENKSLSEIPALEVKWRMKCSVGDTICGKSLREIQALHTNPSIHCLLIRP
jgi:hypothetical protein